MVVMESATSLVKPEVAEEGILETERVKSSGLSAVQLREKSEFSSMLYLLVSPSITLSKKWREVMGGAVRSVVNSREPAGEGGQGIQWGIHRCQVWQCRGSDLQGYDDV